MDDASTQESLELDVTNFGPIIKATVDLRPLTVFVGPSNTGKSYLAILIYALHRYFRGNDTRQERRYRFQNTWQIRDREGQKPRREIADSLINWVQQTFADRRKSIVEEDITLSGPVVDEIRSVFDAQGDQIGNEIGRSFGIDKVATLIRKGSRGGTHIILQRRLANDVKPIEHKLVIRADKTEFKVTIPEGMPIQINDEDELNFYLRYLIGDRKLAADMDDRDLAADPRYKEQDFFPWELLEFLAELTEQAQPYIFGPLHLPAFYLPADRTGVMHAHSAVVSAVIESALMTSLRPAARTSTPMLSGVLADFLQQLIELSYRQREQSADLSTQIESTILGGSVRCEGSKITGYPRFTYRPDGWKDALPLMNASSMVSELAPVVLYLRHMVTPGNLLIVEEPESHLHPAMQVEFTRQLAALVQAGVRVLVTTHSEWVLEELANIVQRSKLPENRRKGDADSTVSLRPDQVGAWLFKRKRRPKGSVVEEVKLDEETGLYPTDYDAVSEELYNDSVNIFNRIQDIKAE